MKPEWRRFAPLGLYLAAIAALAAIALYIIQREWNLYLQISLGLIVIGLALYTILDPEQVRQAFTGRQARYGSNALVLSLAFIGILVVANYLIYQNSQRLDLTEDQQNTLAPETIDTLHALEEPVEAVAFFTGRINTESARSLLDQYAFESDNMFDYRFVDPEADIILAQQANITRDGTVVLYQGDRQETITLVTERELTGAMVRLISGESPAIYFLTGHGERSPDGTGDESYSQAKRTLESKNYTVGILNLLATNNIPADARVIVIAGPTVPLTQDEVSMLQTFAENGGALIVMEEPLPVTDFGSEADPLADYLSTSWGVILGQDIVVDLTSNQPFVAWAFRYADHPITQKMMGLGVFFPTARSVQASGDNTTGTNLTEMVFTADQTWAETDLEKLQNQDEQIQPDEGVDIIGSVPIALVAENPGTGARLVVYGDAEFPTDANYTQFGNGDLFINSVDWAAEQEELINLTPKDSVQRMLVPPQSNTMGLILFGSIFLLPGSVLIAGVVVWWQRRKRG